jgi:hypothetical protein
MKKGKRKDKKWTDYYGQRDLLEEIAEDSVEFSLDDQLVRDILEKNTKGSFRT